MLIQRLIALAIVATFSTLLRVSLIPKLERFLSPVEGDFSTMLATANIPERGAQSALASTASNI